MENERKENVMDFSIIEDGTVQTGGFKRNEAIPLFTSVLVNLDDHQYNPYDPGSFSAEERIILDTLEADKSTNIKINNSSLSGYFTSQERVALDLLAAAGTALIATPAECGLFQDPIIKAFIERKDQMGTQISSPWIYEKNSDRFTHNGIHCHIHRNYSGALCGYVKVPKKIFNQLSKKYNRFICLPGIQVHGGVSFLDKLRYGENNRVVKDGFYIGFDCGHYPDYVPYGISAVFNSPRHYRTWEYVEQQTRQLADQVARIINAQK